MSFFYKNKSKEDPLRNVDPEILKKIKEQIEKTLPTLNEEIQKLEMSYDSTIRTFGDEDYMEQRKALKSIEDEILANIKNDIEKTNDRIEKKRKLLENIQKALDENNSSTTPISNSSNSRKRKRTGGRTKKRSTHKK